jgi:putative cardiolipin synthase
MSWLCHGGTRVLTEQAFSMGALTLRITARRVALLALLACGLYVVSAAQARGMAQVDALLAANPGKTGVYILDDPQEALLARAWLVDQAEHSIEVQYFIWSTDNIGILAAEALIRAANRGVRVRVLVDDLMIDAPDKSLLALAKHPAIDIRIYNPRTSVGVPLLTRVLNVLTDFRAVNQRMHDKTLIVDGKVGITGGRNMATEYFDYNQRYNFRDRDVVLLGGSVHAMGANFEAFWTSRLAERVEDLYDGVGPMRKNVKVSDAEVQQVYRALADYARAPENFAPEVRRAIEATPGSFPRVARHLTWTRVEFIHDKPGKNDGTAGLSGGGDSTAALARLVGAAQRDVVIQTPYLVLSESALELFRSLRARGVRVRISTNSLASTDNLPAFSGYRQQRRKLLAMGLEIFEYRPDAQVQQRMMQQRVVTPREPRPIFSLHAKTVVIDGNIVCIGTYNLDPRSENLNTEVSAVIHDPAVAQAVQTLIETDMEPGNSWHAARDPADPMVSYWKNAAVRALQWLPLRPLL